MSKEKPEKRPERPVIEAEVWHDDVTGLYGLNIALAGRSFVKDSEEAVADKGRLAFEEVADNVDPWPSAWLQEEAAQALADALQAAGITPSSPTEIVAVLQKQLEDMKDVVHGLMDVLKSGQEG